MSKAYKPLPAAEDLWELFSYNPLTGNLHRKDTDRASTGVNRRGYGRLSIFDESYSAHRVVWKWIYGQEPKEHIDHIDGNPGNNRINNLREASHVENSWNQRMSRSNTSGFKGVSKYRSRWKARVKKDGKTYCLGTYDTPEEAHQAYCKAAAELHGDFARVR